MKTISLYRLISLRDDAWLALQTAPKGSVEWVYIKSFHLRLTDLLMDLMIEVDEQRLEEETE